MKCILGANSVLAAMKKSSDSMRIPGEKRAGSAPEKMP
jgi:hypothetical protein